MNSKQYTIATLGSHSSLQILKGAKDEGFKTLLITLVSRVNFYKRFSFIDRIIDIPSFSKFPRVENELTNKNVILIPHGSFVAYLGSKRNKTMKIPYFGNKKVIDWEENRLKQNQWINLAKINTPTIFKRNDKIVYPVIVKSYGAAGGIGYFLACNRRQFANKIKSFKPKKYIIQKYIIGVPFYIHYFYSPITKKIEVLSMDRRYETNVDGLGRIPAEDQLNVGLNPSYVVIGNFPLVLRESMLPEAYDMGERVVKASQKLIDKRGLFGPFCLETIITPDQKFYVIEISCRIVAGTNLYTDGSPYSFLNYDEPMSTGRRIAREIKTAIKQKKLDIILD